MPTAWFLARRPRSRLQSGCVLARTQTPSLHRQHSLHCSFESRPALHSVGRSSAGVAIILSDYPPTLSDEDRPLEVHRALSQGKRKFDKRVNSTAEVLRKNRSQLSLSIPDLAAQVGNALLILSRDRNDGLLFHLLPFI